MFIYVLKYSRLLFSFAFSHRNSLGYNNFFGAENLNIKVHRAISHEMLKEFLCQKARTMSDVTATVNDINNCTVTEPTRNFPHRSDQINNCADILDNNTAELRYDPEDGKAFPS